MIITTIRAAVAALLALSLSGGLAVASSMKPTGAAPIQPPQVAQPAAEPPANAQPQEPPPDPRLAGLTITTLNNLVKLREAQIRALGEDAAKQISELRDFMARREKEWGETFTAWCADRPQCGVEAPKEGPAEGSANH